MRTDRPGRKRTTRPDRQAENQPLIHRGRTKPGRGPAWTAQPQADLPHTDGPRALGGPCLSPQMRPGTTKRGAFPSACQPYNRQREGRLEPFRRSRDGAEASRWLPDRTRRVYHRPSRAARTQQDPGHTVRASCPRGEAPSVLARLRPARIGRSKYVTPLLAACCRGRYRGGRKARSIALAAAAAGREGLRGSNASLCGTIRGKPGILLAAMLAPQPHALQNADSHKEAALSDLPPCQQPCPITASMRIRACAGVPLTPLGAAAGRSVAKRGRGHPPAGRCRHPCAMARG